MSQHFYVTIHGIPLTFKLQFPFHHSAGGSDYFVLHGNIALEDGSGTYAEVSVHLSQVLKDVIGIDGDQALMAAINSIRKTVDTKDIEFLKSTKKQPVHLSSRMWSIVQQKFTFHSASDEQMAEFLKHKAYWTQKITGAAATINDPIEAIYLGSTTDKLRQAAQNLASSGAITLSGDSISPAKLDSAAIEQQTRKALADLQAKHEFERTAAHH